MLCSLSDPLLGIPAELIQRDLSNSEPKKRTRKTKKQNEKELLNDFYSNEIEKLEREKEKEKQNTNTKYRKAQEKQNDKSYEKPYEYMQYLSPQEKKIFESKFTKPKVGNQQEYAKLLKDKNKKIVVATGPAGTGKTLFATEFGVRNFMTGVCEKLIFTRPSVSVDEELGFLPGTLEEKMAPWVRPIYDVLYNFISPKEVSILLEEKIIEIAPLGYMRGRTFKNCWIVADEMQNSTISQMKMLMTRIGENSRLVITGDLEQHDRINEMNGLEDFLNKFRGKRSSSIGSFEFNTIDIQREEVVKEVLEIYSGNIPNEYCNNSIDSEIDTDTDADVDADVDADAEVDMNSSLENTRDR
jgi:phosphate starvation-inducible PhoH-like protein